MSATCPSHLILIDLIVRSFTLVRLLRRVCAPLSLSISRDKYLFCRRHKQGVAPEAQPPVSDVRSRSSATVAHNATGVSCFPQSLHACARMGPSIKPLSLQLIMHWSSCRLTPCCLVSKPTDGCDELHVPAVIPSEEFHLHFPVRNHSAKGQLQTVLYGSVWEEGQWTGHLTRDPGSNCHVGPQCVIVPTARQVCMLRARYIVSKLSPSSE